jgi:hypothetical protein
MTFSTADAPPARSGGRDPCARFFAWRTTAPGSLRRRWSAFQPFHRPADRQPDAGGAGLGFSIARALAEAQGGTLRYEPRPGGGSIFVFSLPAAELDSAALP